MSARAVIDSLEFARGKCRLSGEVQVAELERLADILFDARGTLQYGLSGSVDARQRPRLQLTVAGSINLRCQRCLGKLAHSLTIESSLLVLVGRAGGDTAELDDLDGVPADPQTDVWALVEDEVLLAVPLAPRHPDGECSLAVGAAQVQCPSPFAALARLKQDRMRN